MSVSRRKAGLSPSTARPGVPPLRPGTPTAAGGKSSRASTCCTSVRRKRLRHLLPAARLPTRWEPSRLAWILKEKLLPFIYWNGMLKGREWLAKPAHRKPVYASPELASAGRVERNLRHDEV